MKLIDLFSGFIATTGSSEFHFAHLAACGAFYFGIVNNGTADQKWLDLVDEWFFTNLYFLIQKVLMLVFINKKELDFLASLLVILKYQSMILLTAM
jgi:hypothetical protein